MYNLPLQGTESSRWYALGTRSRHEKHVRDRLAGQGIEQLLPLVRRVSQWSDRKKRIDVPLFAGYCFARFSLHDRLSVLQVPGVVRIVGITKPEPISDEEIQAIEKLMNGRLIYNEHPYFAEGALVRVVRGPLTGVIGQFLRTGGQGYVVIRIHLIQRAAAVHVDVNDCIPLSEAPSIVSRTALQSAGPWWGAHEELTF